MPLSAPVSAAAFIASFTSSLLVSRPSCTMRSVAEPSVTGTRIAMPSSLPFISGITRPIALAAPVDVGMTFDRGRAGAAQVPVRRVEDLLVAWCRRGSSS